MFMKHAIGVLIALTVASASGAMAATMELTPGVGSRMLVNVWSLRELKIRSVILQQYDYSCGSAAVATLLTYHYEHPMTEEVAFRQMFDNGDQEKIQREGFSLLDMKRFLEDQGYLADGFQVSLDDLYAAGIPAIVLLVDNGYHHFVVIKGMRNNKVLIGDPAVGLRVVPREQFEAAWPSRIVFVIHESPARGEFNSARDWRFRPSAPLGQPLGADILNTLLLFRPGGGDF